jgi:hypothetical protein
MNHRPFEDWLINDDRLTPEQDRELRAHIRECGSCSALFEANAALRRAPVATPAAGFTARFQARLIAHKTAQRQRLIWGSILLTIGGVALALIYVQPILPYLWMSTSDAFSLALNYFVSVTVALEALGQVSAIMVGVLARFVPIYIWGAAFLLVGAAGYVWTREFRKFGVLVQGV